VLDQRAVGREVPPERVIDTVPVEAPPLNVNVPVYAVPFQLAWTLPVTAPFVHASARDAPSWEIHSALEARGQLNHTRDQCADRAGPGAIQVWEPATGWRTVAAR
jgi:hypothetical protein